MKISMNQCEGSSTTHSINVVFSSGAKAELMVAGVDEAIAVYKAILLAYENGQDDEANLNLVRTVKQAVAKHGGAA